MTRARGVPFGEFRSFLKGLGYVEKRSETAWVYRHPAEGLLIFRLYGEADPVGEGDLLSTRKFLDMRGLLEEKDFDEFVQQAAKLA